MEGRGRLRPVREDALETVGLLSKGDTRLRDREAQEHYFALIRSRYAQATQDAEGDEGIEARLGNLSISKSEQTQVKHDERSHNVLPLSPRTSVQEKSRIFMGMRKLREAIVASKRADLFAKSVYLFVIRTGVLQGNFESYHPAILHLLQFIHPRAHLSSDELREVTGYHVLDSACRLDRLAEAFELRTRFGLKDKRVTGILKALVRNDWLLFNRTMKRLDSTHQNIARMAQPRLRQTILGSLRASYFTLDVAYVETSLDMRWDAVLGVLGVNWTLENEEKVVIRQMKPKRDI
ncbi:MAG: hypothetical protein M1831_005574 [Alyxoria varia]|nr:MAG: hypothetical protein M1831_005574 [Alyxoria varia]